MLQLQQPLGHVREARAERVHALLEVALQRLE